jgi:ribulose-5-phosphate 4-epimerase/fuculose-1-phosphate aldolase
MKEADAREAICKVGKSLFDRGYVHGTSGNISVRLDDGFLITPTDACLGFLQPERLSLTDSAGRHVAGDRPSKTLFLHQKIYSAALRFDATIRCVIHTHSTYCVQLSFATNGAEMLPALTPYFVMKVGHVPMIPYFRPGDPCAAEWVAEEIERRGDSGMPVRAVMLPRLGPNVWGASPFHAMALLEELEETARLACGLASMGTVVMPLDAAQLADLKSVFGSHW